MWGRKGVKTLGVAGGGNAKLASLLSYREKVRPGLLGGRSLDRKKILVSGKKAMLSGVTVRLLEGRWITSISNRGVRGVKKKKKIKKGRRRGWLLLKRERCWLGWGVTEAAVELER